MNDDSLIVLVHGFCRGAMDMFFWKRLVAFENCTVITPALPTTYGSFEQCLQQLTDQIQEAHPETYKNLYIAGHSMGGLLAREYLERVRPANARRLVCVGTPHRGSKLADIALMLPGAGLIWKPLHALKCTARKAVTTPHIDGLEIGVIISTNNAHWPGRLFFSTPADGLVESFSAESADAKCSAYTNASHVKMQYDAKTAAMIRHFFRYGNF